MFMAFFIIIVAIVYYLAKQLPVNIYIYLDVCI